MTLDVTIGKIIVEEFNPEYPDEVIVNVGVEPCPDLEYDLCESMKGDPYGGTGTGYTRYPRSPYRSGSTPFWGFFRHYMPALYKKMRAHPDSNDRDVARLQPVINEINALPDSPLNCACDVDRMKWFKFWCNRAVELYGKEAGIEFS